MHYLFCFLLFFFCLTLSCLRADGLSSGVALRAVAEQLFDGAAARHNAVLPVRGPLPRGCRPKLDGAAGAFQAAGSRLV